MHCDCAERIIILVNLDTSMEILYLLIPLGMILLVVIAAFFFWSVKSGQMDDLEGPAYRILQDDDLARPQKRSDQEQDKAND